MNSKLILIITGLALALWLASGVSAQPQQPAPSDAGCVARYEAEYSAQWANMSTLQRALVGLNAAGCAP
jgi:hypothetical protein